MALHLPSKFPTRLLAAVASHIVCISVGLSTFAQSPDPSPEQLKHFETHVRPLLIERCYKCHSDKKQSGDLRVDSRGALLLGGESGPALDADDPAASLILEAVRYESFEMPPDGKLSDEEIAHLETWVGMGSPWPGGERVAMTRPKTEKISDEDRAFWSFQPLADPQVPQLDGDMWSRNAIDRFVLSKLREHDLQPAPAADKLTLIRRLYYDMVGLPPTLDQIDRFLADDSPEAYAKVVDEVLSSPRYGEHWARFWLDLVRYAESDGFRKDDYRPHAWRFRDYVINAFNNDKPYNQFVREQLAGDELDPDNPEALAATGYMRHGIYEYNQRDAVTQWQDMLNDITDTTADVFLGMGMGCARCHDHKFDPILQEDYFRLQAFFANISMEDNRPLATAQQRQEYAAQLVKWEEATAEVRAQLEELERTPRQELSDGMAKMFPEDVQEMWYKPEQERTAYERQICQLVEFQVIDSLSRLPTKLRGDDKKKWEELKAELAKFDDLKPAPLPAGRTAHDFPIDPPPVYIPGKERRGAILPGFLTIFEPEPVSNEMLPAIPESSGRRSVLAEWLTRPDHPLTTRVIVNRIWQQHFGTGIVSTPSDLGHLGELPSHPELLDWLAIHFVKHGWSFKWLHREIVLSQTYQQRAVHENAAAEQIDPSNQLLWRAPLKRLTAEQIRDTFLAATGELEQASGGPAQDAAGSRRRSIYTKVMRNRPDPLLNALDFPDRIYSAGDRNVTTTPNQALLLMNSDLLMKRAEAFARRVDNEVSGPVDSKIRHACRILFGRDPNQAELELLTAFVMRNNSDSESSELALTQIPGTNQLGVSIGDGAGEPLELGDHSELPSEDFTVEAVVRLESLYPDASVRSIISQWNGNTSHIGWSLGVTSEKSRYTPQNLILQLVGQTESGALAYEVIPSGLLLDLNRPYRVSVSVNIGDTSETGILFRVVDLETQVERTAFQKHNVLSGYHASQPLVIGGRAGTTQQRWQGHLADIRISNAALPLDQLALPPTERSAVPLANWTFQDSARPLVDSVRGWTVSPAGSRNLNPAMVDLCHVLLNSNELFYID